ncbi:ferredoxin reductase [Mycolicibacter senuensis]|uniref:Oxidoreductase n=1 Tax=Mycolicibacter senuensis TaxID=386913 RepID=A0A7I9XFJ6_9MYCO|nr:ferredoxin reductase [Mycolicibacter senuensis]MDQ2628528.1 ferredoxin reductase [Actinomycetota bacterium]ORW65212.1 ferredoxin reductase [Mycolicibacter senuensis]GFG68732.1 oxidoreductase [Mycolicibacter senuensis]
MARQGSKRRALVSSLVEVLTWPHSIDRYTELVVPTWSAGEARAKVVAVRHRTPRSVTMTLQPNTAFPGFRAGQHLNLTVDIDGRRHTRCYSPANAEGQRLIELTVGLHDGGLVSSYLHQHARPGLVVGLTGGSGDFVLPAARPQRILMVSGGSGITPVMSMLRTLRAEGHVAAGGQISFVHYARSRSEACYRDELAAMADVRVLHGFTRANEPGDLPGYFGADHLNATMPAPDLVYVCGPPALVAAVREHCADAIAENFVPPQFAPAADLPGGRVSFLGSDITVVDDGRPLLLQAESAGLQPASGCRMGLCKTCTCRKTAGTVQNLITGALSDAGEENIQICVSIPVGDVELSL